MIEGPIKQDEVFVHDRTQGEYVCLVANNDNTQAPEAHATNDTQTLMKSGDEGPGEGWEPAVVYYPVIEPRKFFVRSESYFRAKFSRR